MGDVGHSYPVFPGGQVDVSDPGKQPDTEIGRGDKVQIEVVQFQLRVRLRPIAGSPGFDDYRAEGTGFEANPVLVTGLVLVSRHRAPVEVWHWMSSKAISEADSG